HSGKHLAICSSSPSRPLPTCTITMVVVAMAFVIEARSNAVAKSAAGASADQGKRPKNSRHSGPALPPTSTRGARETWATIASRRTRRAASIENTGSADAQELLQALFDIFADRIADEVVCIAQAGNRARVGEARFLHDDGCLHVPMCTPQQSVGFVILE